MQSLTICGGKKGGMLGTRTGQGTAAGRANGKIVDFETRNTTCQICESASKSGKRPHTHDCRKNHTGSSKSVEAGAAAKIYERAKACGNRYSTFIGDEDSTTIARVRQVAGKFEKKNYYSTNSWKECVLPNLEKGKYDLIKTDIQSLIRL